MTSLGMHCAKAAVSNDQLTFNEQKKDAQLCHIGTHPAKIKQNQTY